MARKILLPCTLEWHHRKALHYPFFVQIKRIRYSVNNNKNGPVRWKLSVYVLRKHTGFLANASAAHAPEGPPPITATLNFRELVIGEEATMLKADKRITETNMTEVNMNREKRQRSGRL